MTRHLLYLLVGILWIGLSTSSVQAQTPHNHNFCGVGLTDGQAIKDRMLQNRRNQTVLLQQFEAGRGNDSTVWVPLQFHIVTKSDGTGGESIKDIFDNLCQLNLDYKDLNVEFYLAGPINYVPQDLLYVNDFGATSGFFMGMYRVPGVVNIYIGDRIESGLGSGGTTLGYFTPGIDVIYAIKSAVGANASTLTHELGHFFSLPHTFFGWESQNYDDVMTAGVTQRTPSSLPSGAEVEKIVRSGGTENCQTAADGFCDTDANYLFGFFGNRYNNNGCDYAGVAHDPDGVLFLPEVIRPTASRFVISANDSEFSSVQAALASGAKGTYYAQTVITVQPTYVLGTDTVVMNVDTLGQTDSTDVRISASPDDMIGLGALKLDKGVLTMGDYVLMTSPASTNADLTFIAAVATFTVAGSNHGTFLDSIRVTNSSGAATVAAGTMVDVTEQLMRNGTLVSSEVWSLSLPNALAPGESYTFTSVNQTKSTMAGVEILYRMASVSDKTSGTTSENVMSYYGDNCVIGFSDEQGAAMKADIASRGFATLYPAPNDITITTQATLISPVGPAVVDPTVNLQWDAVNGATYYYVEAYEVNIVTGLPLVGGDRQELLVQGTDVWFGLQPGRNYGWTITPMNATNFCDATLKSTIGRFQTSLTVGVQNVEETITSSTIYPNPVGASQEVILEIQSKKETEAKISIFNSLGQRMMHMQAMDLTIGANVQKLNISSLSAGLYSVTIVTEDGHTSHKLQIRK